MAALVVLLALVVAGCVPTAPAGHPWSGASLTRATNAVPPGSPKPAKPASAKPPSPKPVTLAPELPAADRPPRYPLLTAVERSIGRVSLVNTQAQFVVVDFGFNPLPRPDQRLTVFRTNQGVGTLRMTGVPGGSLMAADIMRGEAQVGDEVREE
jgi:hypothetical protein